MINSKMKSKTYLFLAYLMVFSLTSSALADERDRPGVIQKKKYLHSCPGGTEQVGDGPPKSTVVFCRQYLSDGTRLEGEYTSFYYNGNKKVSGEYIAGKKHGRWTYYTRDGRVRDVKTFEHGKKKKEPKPKRHYYSKKKKKTKRYDYSQNEKVLGEFRKTSSRYKRKRRQHLDLGWPGN